LEYLEERLTPSVAFTPQTTFAAGSGPSAVATADFNGDGRPDLVVVNQNTPGGTVSVLLNTTARGAGAPTFAAPVTFAVGNYPDAVVVGDFNGDGKLDLAVVNNQDGTVSVLLNTTPVGATVPSFAGQVTFAVGSNPVSVAMGDFNGDGKFDLAVVNQNNPAGTVSVLLNTTPVGATVPSFAGQVTFAVGSHPTSVAVGDFNGDNKPDLAVANGYDSTVSVLLDATATGATVPSFASQNTFAVEGEPTAVAVGDFNGDGKLDLVTANLGVGTASVLLNTTATNATVPSFAASQAFTIGSDPTSVAVGDFNSDGKPDIAVASYTGGGSTVSVLLDTTATGASVLSFAPLQSFQVGTGPVSLALGDFNGDGRPDLATANEFGSASVLLDATAVAVAQFGSQGVWEFSQVQNAWVQLTPANATLLADDVLGDVVGEFPGYGLWEYKPVPGIWTQVNGTDVSALAMGTLGDFAATFPHYGVYEYRRGGGAPVQLNPSDAYALAADAAGDVFADFKGYGLYELRSGMAPTMLNGTDVSLLSVNASGELVVDFPGYGVATYTPGGAWKTLTSHQAQALAIDPLGDVSGAFQGTGGGSPPNTSFPGVGTGVYHPVGGWNALTPVVAAQLGMSAGGDVFAEFTGYGVWEFDPFRGWTQLPLPGAADATLLAVV